MKKQLILIIASASLGLFFSCSQQEKKTETTGMDDNNGLVMITPFIESRVMVCDTTQLDLIKDPEKLKMYKEQTKGVFLDEKALELLKVQIKKTFLNPNSLVFYGIDSETVIPMEERKNLYIKCDSIPQSNVDKNGKESITMIFMCDSTYLWDRLTSVRYYESWYVDPKTGEIVKKQLGYSMLQWDSEKEAYREPYIYFTSKEAKEQVKKNF